MCYFLMKLVQYNQYIIISHVVTDDLLYTAGHQYPQLFMG